MNSLGSFIAHQDARQAGGSVAEAKPGNGTHALNVQSAVSVDVWLSEWGKPSDVLEFTREQIFDEVLRLRDDERQRIGQELHDSAGQLLLSLQLSVARLRLTEKNSDHASLIEEIQDTTSLIGQEIRSLAFLNHPAHLHPAGLASALQALISGFGKRTGYRVSFKVSGNQPAPNRNSSMALLRVAQEALVNIHRHARASCVTMRLLRRDSLLELSIQDDGVGMPSADDLAKHGGVGVEGMRFRMEQLGGQFRIRNLKHGMKIWASVPVAA